MSIPPQVELGRSKDDNYGLNIKLYRNGKLHSLLGWMLPKIHNIPKKASNKSFSSSNFNKKVRKGICLSPPGVELGSSKDDTV